MIKEAKEVAELLKVLSNENRLLIVCYLMQEPMTVTQLNEKLDHLTQSALSQHLSLLKAHRILESNKNGLNIIYNIRDERVVKLIDCIKVNFCPINLK
ncbi:Probable HTH-type transcriptional regulator ygaV [uncultured Clostridium sp.]|uniref:ArsR/SmtB family transcription factor n=1 Tax=uncultured Clostridium sp. TaxID=59620 RepID=UPI000821212B|nr:metalloregulator ArsR/SmtB family transcription factor [uncultured Clostridium sp.]SCJ97615.1 Probable HTH-type transcriptional regulator ygaV [uncultured Clostridium sp.]